MGSHVDVRSQLDRVVAWAQKFGQALMIGL